MLGEEESCLYSNSIIWAIKASDLSDEDNLDPIDEVKSFVSDLNKKLESVGDESPLRLISQVSVCDRTGYIIVGLIDPTIL